jgi:trehalose 6-phosphate phosphatase
LVEVIFFNSQALGPTSPTAGERAVLSPLFLWNHLDILVQRCIAHDCCVLFLDYDGTLAAIVEDPAAAQMTPMMQHALTSVLQHPRYRVAVISGRSLTDERKQ